MKKLLMSIALVLTIILAACSSTATRKSTNSADSELATETQLAVGMLRLAGTEQDVSLEQAKELVVYWQVYKELSQSETAAQAEIDGLIAQIQETMTDEQMQSIDDMALTQQDVFASMQGMNVVSSNASDSSVSVPSGPAGGDMPAGGPPSDGGGAPPDGSGMPADMGGAAPASGVDASQSTGAGAGLAGAAGVPTAVVQAVIESLQKKIAS